MIEHLQPRSTWLADLCQMTEQESRAAFVNLQGMKDDGLAKFLYAVANMFIQSISLLPEAEQEKRKKLFLDKLRIEIREHLKS